MSQNSNEPKTNSQKGPLGRGPIGGGPGRHGMMAGEKAKDFSGTMAKLIGYLGKYVWMILIVWILAVLSTVFTIIGPKMLGQATDVLFTGMMAKIAGSGSIDFSRIGEIILFLVVLYVTSAVFMYLQGFVMSGITAKVTFRLRNNISEKMHSLPLGYYDKTTHGEVLSRITNDVDTISQTMNQSMTQIITSVTSIIGIGIMMFSISWRLTLIALVVIPVSLVVVVRIVKKSQKHFKAQQKYLGKVNGHVEEMLSGHVVVKAFNGEEDSARIFKDYNEALYDSAWKSNFLSGLMMPIIMFIGNLSYVSICIFGGYFAANGTMTVGGIQAFIQYVRSFNQPISQIANISNILQQTAAAAERVFEFLGEKEELRETEHALSIQNDDTISDTDLVVHVDGNICFDRVSFGYTPDKTVIHNFSASVMPGQKIAIVGPTGAGKTTMVKLLMRYYDVDNGAILIDGRDIKNFKRGELRSLFGMVLQDTWLFNGTIADNIRYGKLGSTDEEVKEAAIAAQVDHFVRTLPDGYSQVLNEEANNISQGQKQLLTIARAILADPKILILDEATSSVDTRTEILIQKAMDTLMENRTSFIIAHRLSTIKNADLILVMNDGDIVEQGTHNDLLAKNGFYASLYNSQFEKAV
ncbi:ABC-type multidrug transport system, ATPase and permease component [Sphaerochaeta pleomorpha str. Grapes]|uniref:ABC-type multidrug transport system, ATPase and permease component n=1 Tax=Sphaerochaeta pleomorpha (strain ATCC BAA-1885 / DSM 22778 / Grapes) TaxID=158190 RepID=G8QUI9_SPHPG|nr:ABC transporter ATP-binding protein [Sphaerochaeta pleomorpha]AEV29222.1 ABC-type multidrug transport system, ATPase and permease component [Sphaerochaeta pleomorpha str. Grapes]